MPKRLSSASARVGGNLFFDTAEAVEFPPLSGIRVIPSGAFRPTGKTLPKKPEHSVFENATDGDAQGLQENAINAGAEAYVTEEQQNHSDGESQNASSKAPRQLKVLGASKAHDRQGGLFFDLDEKSSTPDEGIYF